MNSYIEICGCIGAGKTTFASNMEAYGHVPIIENLNLNPYLELFHKNPSKVCFEAELTFLIQHYHLIKNSSSYTENRICDFSLVLDRTYSGLLLPPERDKLFNRLVDEMVNEICLPRAIVYLRCPLGILLDRIRARNRPFEQQISSKQLIPLIETLERKLDDVSKEVKIIALDSPDIVISGHECNLDKLSNLIESA